MTITDLTKLQLIQIQLRKIVDATNTIDAIMGAEGLSNGPAHEAPTDEYAPADLTPDELAAAEQIEAEAALGR